MKKRILFILNYRAGTNLFLFTNGMKEVPFTASQKTKEIMGGKELINPSSSGCVIRDDFTGSPQSFYLPTIPEKICPCENYWVSNIENTLQRDPPFEYFSWHTTIGNWWGEVQSHTEVPGPYDIDTPVKFGWNDLALLPGGNWKFIYLTRDGRNQLESLRNIPGGIEQEYHRKDPENYFQVLCKTYRNKARVALDCKKYLDFKIVKFENMTQDCLGTMRDIYNFIGLPIDEEFVRQAYELTLSRREQHSSFKTKDWNDRWKSHWSSWEIEKFKEIAGKELDEMGYGDW